MCWIKCFIHVLVCVYIYTLCCMDFQSVFELSSVYWGPEKKIQIKVCNIYLYKGNCKKRSLRYSGAFTLKRKRKERKRSIQYWMTHTIGSRRFTPKRTNICVSHSTVLSNTKNNISFFRLWYKDSRARVTTGNNISTCVTRTENAIIENYVGVMESINNNL